MPKKRGGFLGRRWFWILLLVGAGWVGWFWVVWNQKALMDSSGGLYFPVPVRLEVPGYRQNDGRWGRDRRWLGTRQLRVQHVAHNPADKLVEKDRADQHDHHKCAVIAHLSPPTAHV